MVSIKKASQVEQVLLSVEEVAIMLGVCRQTAYNLIYREGLPTIQVGRSLADLFNLNM